MKPEFEISEEELVKKLRDAIKPYDNTHDVVCTIPERGKSRDDVIALMKDLKSKEESRWREGLVSGAVYHGDPEFIDFLNQVYAINSQSNPLHSDLWPSVNKFETEIVSMTADMLGGNSICDDEPVGGSVSSGGTESILLAMKTYRDWAMEEKEIKNPEMIVPVTAHAAFDKASKYFNIKMVQVPVDDGYRADVKAVRDAITKNTAVIVGSAPTYPHGVIDSIGEMSELAREQGIGFHTDSCLGGFILPWARKLGYEVPPFDFELPGVTSISADTHKYGYASKGTSVIVYRSRKLWHFQFYKTTEWPGGIYYSPGFAGSRPGALIAVSWAALVSMGEAGYLEATEKILKTAEKIKKGINKIPDLEILGDPLWVIAFKTRDIDIFRVMEHMSKKGWNLNGLHKPACVHIAVTLRHTQEGVADRLIRDLKESIDYVKANPSDSGQIAPFYGMAATIPDRSTVSRYLDIFMDVLFSL